MTTHNSGHASFHLLDYIIPRITLPCIWRPVWPCSPISHFLCYWNFNPICKYPSTIIAKARKKYYGPIQLFKRIEFLAYELNLPASSQIHLVFHVSLPKSCLGRPDIQRVLSQMLILRTKSGPTSITILQNWIIFWILFHYWWKCQTENQQSTILQRILQTENHTTTKLIRNRRGE